METADFRKYLELLAEVDGEIPPEKQGLINSLTTDWGSWQSRYDALMNSCRLRGDEVRKIRAEKEFLERQFGVKVKTPRPRERTFWEKVFRKDPNKPRIK